MLASVAIAPLNHLLRGESWARKRLQRYPGKTARFRLPPFPDFAVTVQASGELSSAPQGTADDAVLRLAPGLLPRLLARDERAYQEIHVSGDSEFAEEIIGIGKNLHWNAEQDLSALFGDVVAHRVAQSGKSLMHWHTETIRNLLQALMEYWTEERLLLARPANMRSFAREVKALQDRTTHLEQRLSTLIAR